MLRDLQNCGPLQNLGDEGLFDRTLFDFRSHQKWEIYNKQLTKDQQVCVWCQLIEVDYSLAQFKSAKLKDNQQTLYAPSFYATLQNKERD